MTTINVNHVDFAKAQNFMNAWREGEEWAANLKQGDMFNGALGEAKIRYSEHYSVEGFTSGAWQAIKTKKIWVDNSGIITKIIH